MKLLQYATLALALTLGQSAYPTSSNLRIRDYVAIFAGTAAATTIILNQSTDSFDAWHALDKILFTGTGAVIMASIIGKLSNYFFPPQPSIKIKTDTLENLVKDTAKQQTPNNEQQATKDDETIICNIQ